MTEALDLQRTFRVLTPGEGTRNVEQPDDTS